MTKKITELTKEQEAKIPQYTQEGIDIGFSTDTASDEEILEYVDKHRELVGMSKSETTLFYDSPMAAIEKHAQHGITASNCFYGTHDIHWLQFYTFFRKECGLLEETDQIKYLYEVAKRAGWIWFGNTATIITRKPVAYRTTLVNHDSMPSGTLALLHSEDNLAVEYADGKGIYALSGVRIPESEQWLITNPERRSGESILRIENTDIRMAALKLLGSEGIVGALPSTVIDEATFESYHSVLNGRNVEIPNIEGLADWCKENLGEKKKSHYRLLELTFEEQQRIYLEMTCPSKGEKHVEAVHPQCRTVASALHWKETREINNTYIAPLIRT